MADSTPTAAFLARLKSETRPEHDAIEAVLNLTSDELTRPLYYQTLRSFYGFYRPVEERLWAAFGPYGTGLEPAERMKTSLLEADLRILGVDVSAPLPICRHLPRIDTAGAAFGCLYVMEGATLGGQVISRHIRQTLGITPQTGGRFFDGYGEQTGVMWKRLQMELVAFAKTLDEQNQVVEAAVQTFGFLRAWCQQGETL